MLNQMQIATKTPTELYDQYIEEQLQSQSGSKVAILPQEMFETVIERVSNFLCMYNSEVGNTLGEDYCIERIHSSKFPMAVDFVRRFLKSDFLEDLQLAELYVAMDLTTLVPICEILCSVGVLPSDIYEFLGVPFLAPDNYEEVGMIDLKELTGDKTTLDENNIFNSFLGGE